MMADVCPTCGAKTKSIRSVDQHRRIFAVVRAAFLHWPETNSRQFPPAEGRRKYLKMPAGNREPAARIPPIATRKEQAIILAEAAIRAAGAFAVPEVHGAELVIWKPQSINFASLSHLKFCDLNRAVDEVLVEQMDMTGDQLLAEHETTA